MNEISFLSFLFLIHKIFAMKTQMYFIYEGTSAVYSGFLEVLGLFRSINCHLQKSKLFTQKCW